MTKLQTTIAVALLAQCWGTFAGPMGINEQVAVSESGAALYTMPIMVPPGAGDLEPNLAFSYNSQAANGILGVGWSVSGLSVITRCPRTIAQDGVTGGVYFDANDRFCLDGERLVSVSGTYGANGTQYRTERDSFSKIVSYGTAGSGPAWFKVWSKSGQIFEFGNTANSRIEAQGKTSARTWAVNRVSDSKGNYRTLTYTEDATNGYYYPQRIDYTGNTATGQVATSSVQFTYESRTDTTVLYLGGSLVKPTQRLSKLKTAVGASTVTEYRLVYGQSAATSNSKLLSITECGADSNCLPAVSISWADSASTLPATYSSSATESFATNLFASVQYLMGDINGDGRDDLVMVWREVGSNQIGRRTWLADANGNLATTYSYSATEAGFTPHLYFNMQFSLADTNGDGRKDLVWTWRSLDTLGRVAWLADSSGGFPATYSSYTTTTGFTPSLYVNSNVQYGDVNGDGRDDLVWVWNTTANLLGRVIWLANADGSYSSAYSSYVTQTDFTPQLYANQHYRLGDVNGDGLVDIVWLWTTPGTGSQPVNRVVWLAQPGGTYLASHTSYVSESGLPTHLAANQRIFLTDVNGDGRMDLTWAWNTAGTGSQLGRVVWLSKGDGTFSPTYTSFTQEAVSGVDPNLCLSVNYFSLDINADHRSDLLWTCSIGNVLYRATWISNPSGVLPATYSSLNSESGFTISAITDQGFAIGDTNGDGKNDLIWAWRSTANGNVGRVTHRATTGIVDQVTGINNGIGNVVSVAYKTMTDATVYTKDTNAVYPQRDLQIPLYIVSSFSEPNDVGGTMTTNYTYGGAKTNLQGRGLLGIRWINAAQVETGLSTRSEFRLDWPYLGLKSSISKKTVSGGSGGVLETTTNTYGCKDFVSASGCTVVAGRRYFPFLSNQVVTKWDLNGAALPTVTKTQQFDTYGNPTSIAISASDGYSKTTTNTYLNNTTNWYIGLLTGSTIVGVSP